MIRSSRKHAVRQPDANPMVAVVLPLKHSTRRALYAASNSGVLYRHTWNGCAFNRAGAAIGVSVRGNLDATRAFDEPTTLISDFVRAWDRLSGSNAECTALLREAILIAGLFPDEPAGRGPRPGLDQAIELRR